MNYAAPSGHIDLVDFLIHKGANCWDLGMRLAAKGGHQDFVDFLSPKV